MTTPTFKMEGFGPPLAHFLSQKKMILPPQKPRIWEDRLENSLGKKRDTSEFDGSAYNQQSHVFPPSFHQLFNGILDILYIFVYFMYFMDFMNFLYFAYFVFYLYFRKKT